MVLSWAGMRDASVETGGISTAFLRGQPLQRAVQMAPPPEDDTVSQGQVYVMKKAAYGLVDAPILWYESPRKEAERLGAEAMRLDPGFLRALHLEKQTLRGLVVVNVDDCIFAGGSDFFEKFVRPLHKVFPFGSIEDASRLDGVRFTGMRIFRHPDGMFVNQSEYILELHLVPIAASRSNIEELTWQEQAGFRSLLGAVSWVAQRTRPDIA